MLNLLTLLLINTAGAQSLPSGETADPLQNKKLACRTNVTHTLSEWKSKSAWRGTFGPRGFESLTPTTAIGVWIGVFPGADRVEMVRYAPGENLSTTLTAPDCVPVLKITPALPKPTQPKRPVFTDSDLVTLLRQSSKTSSRGIIYIWSPRMNWSIQGANEIKEICKELGLKLTLLMDPASDESTDVPGGNMRLESRDLLFMGARNHFPSFFYYEKGELKPLIKTGYDKPSVMKRILAAYAKM